LEGNNFKAKVMKFKYLYLFILIVGFSCSREKNIKIACIGDSITEGAGIDWQSRYGYPEQLDSILGAGFSVLNCGKGGTCMIKNSDNPYWTSNAFYNVFAFNPDIIIIKLGTNDSKPQNWNQGNYLKDFQSMIDTLKTIPSHPEIILCLPVPAYNHAWGINDSIIRNGVIPSIKKIAEANQLTTIDLYKPLSNHVEFFPDSIHPNVAGARCIAEEISRNIKPKK
jgi:acyl-CoA thioesterase I